MRFAYFDTVNKDRGITLRKQIKVALDEKDKFNFLIFVPKSG